MAAFNTLLAQVRVCTLCQAHLPLGPRAHILIVGQAPGRKVHESGIPFDDASGDRLLEWLGVSREQFYDPAQLAIVPMGLCYPGTGKSGDNPPRQIPMPHPSPRKNVWLRSNPWFEEPVIPLLHQKVAEVLAQT
jgi:uracil-DNA glycosylase